jgi:YVTN family beta-propeller protein
MRQRRAALFIATLFALGAAPAAGIQPLRRLPSQQLIQAVGKSVDLGIFPAGMALSTDGRLLLVTNNASLFQSLTVVDTATLATFDQIINSPGANILFIGVALSPDGHVGYASGHSADGSDALHTVALAPGPTLTIGADIAMPSGSFPAGLAMSRDGSRLFVAFNLTNALGVVDVASRSLSGSVGVGRLPWAVALHPSLPQAYVTNRADDTVSIIDTEQLQVVAEAPTGKGPNAVAVSPDGDKVFVANATSDDVTVFDVNHPESTRNISLAPFAGAKRGSSPNALAFSTDGSRVYVANAWDNALVVVDAHSEAVLGMIPTGWYPSGVAVSPDNRTLYVANMKGPHTFPRTRKAQRLDYDLNRRFGGSYAVPGSLQVAAAPNDNILELLTRRVRFYNGFDTGIRPGNRAAAFGSCFPIPCGPGDLTPIKHVFFIVRENKTYDQELSDLPQGDGESRYLLYGRQVTPNLHKLVEEFVLMDRFFANSEKSEPGHQWTTAAIDSDYVEKTWTSTSIDGRPDDIAVHADQGFVTPVAQPDGLYWFDNCHQHGVTFRSYGEFLRTGEDGQPIDYWLQNSNLDYRRFNLDITDISRFEVWKRDFDQQVATGGVPQFTYMTLANDHTKGTDVGAPDPRSFVADNDYATGKVVEAISNSSVWAESVIFLLEDDPQSGADHVDSHRTVGTVIGPYVRRHYVSHARFDMSSMHRTMELILGLPPMSQFDQMAIPMRELFTDTPNLTPYNALPPSFPMMLTHDNPGAEISAKLDWSRPDRVPDELLNQLLWDYLKGDGSQKSSTTRRRYERSARRR